MTTGKSCKPIPKSKFPLEFKVTSPVHALRLAKKLVVPYKQWTTGAFAVRDVYPDGNSGDDQIDYSSPEAEAFCALGALRRVNSKHELAAQTFLFKAAASLTGSAFGASEDVFEINDDEGRNAKAHRKVLKMFDLAITLAQKAARRKA